MKSNVICMKKALDCTFTQCSHGNPKCEQCKNIRVINWISVEDELPQDMTIVMTSMTLLFHEFKIAFYNKGAFYANQGSDENLAKWVTHWADISRLKPK